MTSCKRFQDQLVDAVYGTLAAEESARFQAHVAECRHCASEYQELAATVELLRREAPPRPSPEQLDGVWERLVPRLDEPAPREPGKILSFPQRLFPRKTWLPLAAAAAMILAVIGLTVPWSQDPGSSLTPPIVASTEADLDEDLGRYYARATPLLLSLSNRDPSRPAVDAAAERRVAQRLATEAERLRIDLEAASRQRELTLVNDLAVVFLQLANLCESEYRKGIELLQTTLDHRAILFQLTVEELRRDVPSISKTTA